MEKTFRAKKSLGQNFLKDKRVISDIIDSADVNLGDVVLEIGPGKGVLTEKLVSFAGKVIAIEKDDNLFLLLKEKFENEINSGKLDLINGDALDFDPNTLSFYKDLDFKIVANIPYNITGAIIEKFLSADFKPISMTLLVQKEVAQRIASSKKESILSLSVKLFGNPEYIKKVPARAFSPAPRVDSAILHVSNIHKNLSAADEITFFKIIKTAFSEKRKFVVNNLSKIFDKEKVISVFQKLQISAKARAEDLHLDKWLSMLKELNYPHQQ